MNRRPFRHLCPEADLRDAMSDDEFWAHVADNLVDRADDIGHPDYDTEPAALNATPCDVCGEAGACGYDAEGRPLIHATEEEPEA